LIGLHAAALRFSIESWLFAPPRTARVNLYCIAFGRFLTFNASNPSIAGGDAAPPKGGLLAVGKPMKLPGDERHGNLFGPRPVPALCASSEVVGCGVDAGLTQWLLRRALAQHSWLVFSVLDGLRVGGYRVGTRGPCTF